VVLIKPKITLILIHSDLDSRTKWRGSIDKEFKEMNVRGFSKKIINPRCLLVFNVSKVNGCLESSEMMCFDIDLLPVGTAKFRVL
jgi:hypothetical protein